MNYISSFRRYELKYLVTEKQYRALLPVLSVYMSPDEYFHSEISNVYYDTDNYRLIRRSLEKPVYKEKFRLRAYSTPESDTQVYLELKKKFESVVYKRRVGMPYSAALRYLAAPCGGSQKLSEIARFFECFPGLSPAMYIYYSRDSYRGADGLRITFDRNITYRTYDVDLSKGVYGEPILDGDMRLLEIKTGGGLPLWLTSVLSAERIYRTSFSKYGRAYLAEKENKNNEYAEALPGETKNGGLIYA